MSEGRKTFWESVATTFNEMAKPAPKDPEIEAAEFLAQALDCLDVKKTRHDRQSRAAALARKLRGAHERVQGEYLAALAVGLGADRSAFKSTVDSIDWSDVDMSKIESDVLGSLGSKRRALCLLWLSMDGALEFLVWLREKTISRAKEDPAVGPLKEDLDYLMGVVFSQGLLQMRPITWRSPALLLEKIKDYEQVHEMGSWGELKSRLDLDRRVYALFHSGWSDEPLAFLEVALTKGIAKSIGAITGQGEELDVSKADTATFYSINAPHAGLKGISFGEDLIRKSVDALRAELPHVKTFCTLSPIPGFARWVAGLDAERFKALAGAELIERLDKRMGRHVSDALAEELSRPGWHSGPLGEASKELLVKLCAKYLAGHGSGKGPSDPVARFHLGNGARVEALRHLGDCSPKGLAQSFGMMVNYLYDLSELEKNKLSHGSGAMAASWSVRRLAQG